MASRRWWVAISHSLLRLTRRRQTRTLLTDCSHSVSLGSVSGQKLRRLLPHDVLVDAARHLRAGGSEDHLDDLDRHTARPHERARPVPGVVHPIIGRPHSRTCCSNSTVTRSGRNGAPSGTTENQIMIVVVDAEELPFDRLRLPVSSEGGKCWGGEWHPWAARPGLRRLQQPCPGGSATPRSTNPPHRALAVPPPQPHDGTDRE
jgi:hypothetical protein